MLKGKKSLWNRENSFFHLKGILHHQPSAIPSLASQLSEKPTVVDENEGLGTVFVGDIFVNRVSSEHASYRYFSLVNT